MKYPEKRYFILFYYIIYFILFYFKWTEACVILPNIHLDNIHHQC